MDDGYLNRDNAIIFMKYLANILFIIGCLAGSHCTLSGQNPVKIMPLGNSITRGETDGTITEGQMKGYRYDLKQLLQSAGFNVDFVGSESAGYNYFTDCQHAGIGGSRDQYVAQLLLTGYDARWDRQIINPPGPYLDVFNPDIILLHIGTNDITHEDDPIAVQQVSTILDLIDQYEVRANHEVVVFLALIINRRKPWVAGSGAATTTAFNNYIKTMAQARIAAGDKIVIVDMENDAGFLYTDTDMSDDLHPNAIGYNKMANLWFSSITGNYNTPPIISPIPDQYFNEGGSSGLILLDDYVTDIEDEDQYITWTVTQLETNNLNIEINANRQVTATPKSSTWYGTQEVVFTATDRGKNGLYIKSENDTVIYTVNRVNRLPEFITSPILTIRKGEQYIYNYEATDEDTDDILQYSIPEKPSWLTLYPNSKMLAGIPQQTGNFPVIVRVNDGHVNVDQSFTIEVTGPTALPGNIDDRIPVIYPNPATDYFVLKVSSGHTEIELALVDEFGRFVLKKTICPDCERVISIKDLKISPGVYMYYIASDKGMISGRLVIARK
jgi:lysophospholipase L1-like esterase